MTNLFIIGNGFDIAHGMETRYNNFKQFLIDKYNINEKSFEDSWYEIPYPRYNQEGDPIYEDTEVVTAIIRILDETQGWDWNDIETALGMLDYSGFLDFGNDFNDSDEHSIKIAYYNNEDSATAIHNVLVLINSYFEDWISTIELSKYKLKDFQDLINADKDLFLNFNYTLTLEKLYNVQNVCHIHGISKDNIYFGHGNDKDYTDKFQRNWFGAEYELNLLQKALRKRTDLAYKNNIQFFNQIKTEATKEKLNIYSYGFSFSPVDNYYLEHIFKLVDTGNIIWFLNDYNTLEERKIFKKNLRKCGYKGKIKRFHIDCNNIIPIIGLFNKNVLVRSVS